MSKVIRNDHPWNEKEIAYLLSRGRTKEVAENAKQFPPGSKPKTVEPEEDSVVLELSQQVYEYVSSRTIPQLKSDLRKANLSTVGDETELRVALAQHLQGLEDAADA
jgi:hypothetical protein